MQPEPCPLILGGKGFIRQGSSGRLITSTGLEACNPAASWATLAFSLCMRGSQGSPWCFYSLSWCLSLRGAEVPDPSSCLPPGESLTVLSEAFKVSPSVWHFASGGYRLPDVLTSLFYKICPTSTLAGSDQSWGGGMRGRLKSTLCGFFTP